MNRETILASVHHQLRDSLAETGEVRPLGEIVARVAGEIRPHLPSNAGESPGVISIERVAAFVEGALEPAESQQVCQAVMVDNSVLAEVIAAVRSQQTDVNQLPPLSSSLSERLLSMRPTVATNADREASVLQPTAEATSTIPPVSRRDNRLSIKMAATLVAIAATVLIAISLVNRSGSPTIVQDPLPSQTTVTDPGVVEPETESTVIPSDTVAESGSTEPEELLDPPDVPLEPEQAIVEVSPEPGSHDVAVERMPSPPPELNPLVDPESVRIHPEEAKLVDVRWTEVSGLLAQRDPADLARDETTTAASETTVAAATGMPKWRRVQEGALYSDRPEETRVALTTLPFSRAEAELGEVGKLVVSADTGLQIERAPTETTAELDLRYGSIALVGVNDGATVRLNQAGQTVATLRWKSRASAVVQSLANGLQIQVDGGSVQINDTDVREDSVRVGRDRAVETVQAPRRLPTWVSRADKISASDRSLLAQLAESDDLALALNRKIRSLTSAKNRRAGDDLTLKKLASWQAAMAGPGIYRLAGSRIPAVRFAALQRLAHLNESDPRYEHTWNTIDKMLGNQQRSNQVKAWFRLIRARRRPNTAQMNQLLNGLANPDPAGRALSDFILRQYVANPPPFDPSWSGKTLQRAISVYRQRAGLPVDRARANALSPSATN